MIAMVVAIDCWVASCSVDVSYNQLRVDFGMTPELQEVQGWRQTEFEQTRVQTRKVMDTHHPYLGPH